MTSESDRLSIPPITNLRCSRFFWEIRGLQDEPSLCAQNGARTRLCDEKNWLAENGASEGIRTLDTHVGNVMLYQAELRSLPRKRC